MELPGLAAGKEAWRAWAQRTRRGLPEVSQEICAQLVSWMEGIGIRSALSYRAFGSEVNLEALPQLLPQVAFYQPRTEPGRNLSVHRWEAPLARSPLGMLEPVQGDPPCQVSLDLVLVPGLAFDRSGRRLGWGGGYYDRFLRRLGEGPLRVGVTPAALLVPELPGEAHDQLVQIIATERGIWKAGSAVS